jgi:myo-inositol-1(or 4)-monophosphatase
MNINQATKLIEYIVESGKRISLKAGKIEDIGVKKLYLTEEDIIIERGIKEIVNEISGSTAFYAEEENDTFIEDESVWVCDPISGTKLFIQGLPHYAIVASHLSKGVVDFAVVYDPSSDDLFTADRETGAFLNGKLLTNKIENHNRIIFAQTSQGSISQETKDRVKSELEKTFEVFPSQGSFALNYCLVASGEFDGVVAISKDSYPEFAGCFIANMAGYKATNINGIKDIVPKDRQFVCGKDGNYEALLNVLRKSLN